MVIIHITGTVIILIGTVDITLPITVIMDILLIIITEEAEPTADITTLTELRLGTLIDSLHLETMHSGQA